MRSINPETGKPYSRRRPIKWDAVRSILRYRQEDRRLCKEGFEKVGAFAPLPWETNPPRAIIEARIAHDGRNLYVKIAPAVPHHGYTGVGE